MLLFPDQWRAMMKVLPITSAKHVESKNRAWLQKLFYVVSIGVLVACNFALSKYAVTNGLAPIDVTVMPMAGAAFLLILLLLIQKKLKISEFNHFQYYVVAGLLGVSLPNLASSLALQELNASTFSVLVTLSPIFTLLFAFPFERKSLTKSKTIGIFVGLLSALLVTVNPSLETEVTIKSLLIALAVPLLLGAGNVYRSKAVPSKANPIALAAGMLTIQSLLWLPVSNISAGWVATGYEWVLGVMTINAALSYLLTFRFQQVTDGVGFSQVGNVVTVTGVLIGVTVYGEAMTFELVLAILLLGCSLYLFNKS